MYTALSTVIRLLNLNNDTVKINGNILTIKYIKEKYDLKKIEVVKIKPWISMSDGEFNGYDLIVKHHK